MKEDVREEMLALYALGVPTEALSEWFSQTPKFIRNAATDSGTKRPDRSDGLYCHRVARVERMQRHAAEYPGTSLFSTLEAAA